VSNNKSKPSPNDPANPPVAARVTNTVQPGAPGVSLEETVESNVERIVKEFGPPVVTAMLVVILAAAGWAFYVSRQESIVSNQWDQLDVGIGSKNVANLQGTADAARGSLVGAVATNVAGITELNAALEKLVRDPEKAKQEIRASIDRFKQVVDYEYAPEIVQQQAKYALAFAHEALGEFEQALPLYQELAALKDTPTERFAKDGVQRCQDPTIRAFHERLATWKPSNTGTAPPDFSNLSPEILDLIKDVTPPATENPAGGTPATETPATQTPATETPAGGTPATETPATGTATPATENPANQDQAPKLPGGGSE
jgi:hypothetical protein